MNSEATYALESYDKKEDSYTRYDVGDMDNMVEAARNAMLEDAKLSCDCPRYYRVVPVSDEDKSEWYRQRDMLPGVKSTDRVFGSWISINRASKYLGVTFGRVFNLVTSGSLTYKQIGRSKLVSVHDVVSRKINNAGPGRPSKESSCNDV